MTKDQSVEAQLTHPVEVATKVTQTLPRENGAEAKIVAETMFGAGLKPSVDVYVFRRASPEAPWQLCSKEPASNWRQMPVDQYIKEGRSEMLKAVTHGEILKVVALLGQPMSRFAPVAQA